MAGSTNIGRGVAAGAILIGGILLRLSISNITGRKEGRQMKQGRVHDTWQRLSIAFTETVWAFLVSFAAGVLSA